MLRDLARFCYANESTFDANQTVQNGREGRREVWLRVQHHLKLTDDQLWILYNGGA